MRPTILVIISIIRPRNLPPQPPVARLVVPVRARLGVEHGLRQRQPLRFILWWIRKVVFRGQHRRHAPEPLIVVPQGGGDVGGHVVLVWAYLPQHGLGDEIVVAVVAGEFPVVDQGPPHGAAFPPVVIACWGRTREDAGGLAGEVAFVVLEEVPGEEGGGLFDVGWGIVSIVKVRAAEERGSAPADAML